ncbi:MAG: hypothetical protein AAB356_09265, partial [Deltaproteobacteria bacterium]
RPLGFLPEGQRTKDVKKDIMREVENRFSPEFLNRIDDIVVFTPLTREEVRILAVMHLDKIRCHLEGYGKHMAVSEKAVESIVDTGYSIKYGARFLKRRIDELVKVPLTVKWKEGDFFKIDLADGEVVVEAAPAGELSLV